MIFFRAVEARDNDDDENFSCYPVYVNEGLVKVTFTTQIEWSLCNKG